MAIGAGPAEEAGIPSGGVLFIDEESLSDSQDKSLFINNPEAWFVGPLYTQYGAVTCQVN